MADSTDRYPSPKPSSGLPFYQHNSPTQPPARADDARPPPEQPRHEHQAAESAAPPPPDLSAGDHHAPTPSSLGADIRDARASVATPAPAHAPLPSGDATDSSAMASFSAWGTPMMGQNGAVGGVPAGSIAFAQASGSPDAAHSAQDKHKEKRTKVSRACDECRRKKIRCDAIDETGSVPCTNCAR